MNIELRNVEVTFGENKVISEFNTVFKTGINSLLGANAAGKSTILKSILGLVEYSGSILFDGKSIGPSCSSRAELIAYMPQKPIFPYGMTVYEYVLFGRFSNMGLLANPSRKDTELVQDVLYNFDLEKYANLQVSKLSGGEQKRVCLARTFSQDSQIILLDEPEASLDINYQYEIMDKISLLAKEKVCLIAIHNLSLASMYSDEICFLLNGELYEKGKGVEVFNDKNLSAVFDSDLLVEKLSNGQSIVIKP